MDEQKNIKQSKGTWKLFVGIVIGILIGLLGVVWYKGYFTLSIPRYGLITVKLPTYGMFTEEGARLDYQELDRKLEEIEYYMDNEYYYAKDTDGLEDAAVKGVFSRYTSEDGYSQYYTSEEYLAQLSDWRGSYVGIGAYVTTDEETGGVMIVRPMKNSPAMEAGLRSGDIIISADGVNICGMELETATEEYIKGEAGSTVILEILRDGETFEIEIVRRSVDTETVYYSVIDDENGRTGYIYVSTFVQSTYNGFVEAVDELEKQQVDGIVVDLRENLGGDMNTALNMTDYLLDDHIGTYTQEEPLSINQGRTILLSVDSKEGIEEKYFAQDMHSVDIPITVLVDGYSASASEIFAGVMQSYGYKVCGTQSYGKGIVQTVRMLYDMSGIKYTSAEYVLPNSMHIHGVGITPDVLVEASENLMKIGVDPEKPDPSVDNMLESAIRTVGE